MGKKILLGLSDAEAGRVAGCSRVAIFNAKREQRLLSLSDGSVSPAELDKFIQNRRAPRFVKPGQISKSDLRSAAAPPPGHGAYRDIPAPVISLAVMAEYFASDVVLALLPILPEEGIRPVYDLLLAQWRADGAELADNDFEPPVGFQSWALHPLFSKPVKLDWQELRDLATPAPEIVV